MKPIDLDLLTADEVAKILHCSRRHVIEELKKEIKFLKIGREVVFDPKDVRAYIRRKKRITVSKQEVGQLQNAEDDRST